MQKLFFQQLLKTFLKYRNSWQTSTFFFFTVFFFQLPISQITKLHNSPTSLIQKNNTSGQLKIMPLSYRPASATEIERNRQM